MIGFRDASRYNHPRYRAGFALESQAVKKVHEVMGLTNLKVMILFAARWSVTARRPWRVSRPGKCAPRSETFFHGWRTKISARACLIRHGDPALIVQSTAAVVPDFDFMISDLILLAVGIALLVVSSVCFCLLDTNARGRWQSFFLMLAASLIQVAALLIEKRVFDGGAFFMGFLLITVGIIVTGAAPLLIPSVRAAFIGNMATLRPAIPMIVGIEIANLIALLMSQRAISLGDPSLVAAVESSIPAYTFVLAVLLLAMTKRFGDDEARHWLPFKLALVVVMAVGVWRVS